MKLFFFFQAEDGIRDDLVTGVQTCALPICRELEFIAGGKRAFNDAHWDRGRRGVGSAYFGPSTVAGLLRAISFLVASKKPCIVKVAFPPRPASQGIEIVRFVLGIA